MSGAEAKDSPPGVVTKLGVYSLGGLPLFSGCIAGEPLGILPFGGGSRFLVYVVFMGMLGGTWNCGGNC